MPDYKEMYLKMMRATEEAINCLISAQRVCEEMYLQDPEHEIETFEKETEDAV